MLLITMYVSYSIALKTIRYILWFLIATIAIAIVNFTLTAWKLWITFRMNEMLCISNESLTSPIEYHE